MKNDTRSSAKRTVKQVREILKADQINCDKIYKFSDGCHFDLEINSDIKNRFALKNAGFFICNETSPNFIRIKCY